MQQPMPEFATDLESLLAGRLAEAELRTRHPVDEYGQTSETIWRNLETFLGDAKRRQTDLPFCHQQLAQMRKLIKLIEAGGTVTEFASITFAVDR